MNFVTLNGTRLTYQSDGPDDAPTMVMINSLGTNLHMWDPQMARLDQTPRIVRYDCRGHGSSDIPAGPYTIQQLGLDLTNSTQPLPAANWSFCVTRHTYRT